MSRTGRGGACGLNGQLLDIVQEGRAGLAEAPCACACVVGGGSRWPTAKELLEAACPQVGYYVSIFTAGLVASSPSAEEEVRADGKMTCSGSYC